jgi:hypothetical protein
MRKVYSLAAMAAAVAALAACSAKDKEQLAVYAHADSLHTDSLSNVRKELLEEVMTSTQFVNDINGELAKARALAAKPKSSKLETAAEGAAINDQRKEIVGRITMLVSELNASEGRLASVRARAEQMSKQDSGLLAQVATFEKQVADLQASAQQERTKFQATIDSQSVRIVALGKQVDTLSTQRTALADTVGQLTTEKNAAYYIVGTKDELIKKGVLVAEGPRRFLIVGSRPIVPARTLDPTTFTKIDRLANPTITLPEGEYEIVSRQNPDFATPKEQKDGKISGGLTISRPEQFWGASKFLIIVRS